jgi:transaldolase
VVVAVNERLKKLREIGQSVWVDSLSRDDIQNGNLRRMTEDGVLGVTSNPTILQQAIAQSELVYQEFKKIFSGPNWESLESRGPKKQRPLWASTSTKNPEYKDTIYVDKLIGPETVNTMPLSTLKATMDHADVRPTLEEGLGEARKLFEELKEADVDCDDVVEVLEKEGVQKFADSYEVLIEEIEQKCNRLARQA